jgi:hypothetical protein
MLAPGACTALYSRSMRWEGGYSGTLVVRNDTDAPIDGWTLGWRSAADVEWVWGGTVSQADDAVRVADASWNKTVPVGGTLRVEFMVAGAADDDPGPTLITLNDVPCQRTDGKAPAE